MSRTSIGTPTLWRVRSICSHAARREPVSELVVLRRADGIHHLVPGANDRWDLSGAIAGRKVLGERQLLWRYAVLVLPRRERLPVAADVLAGSAEREQHEAAGAAVGELAAHGRRNAHELSALERLLLTLDQQGERSVEHEVDLLLLRMAVDAATLAGFEHHLVEPEGRDPELAAEGDEALGCVEVEPRAGDARFHDCLIFDAPIRHSSSRLGYP